MKRFAIFLFLLALAMPSIAQKAVYIPQQTLKDEGYNPSTTVNDLSVPWCRYRSRESDNIIVFWAAGYGDNDPNSPAVPEAFRVDIDDLLRKLEAFYDLNVNRLKFADLSNSNLSRYKMVICLYYTTEWMAYGSGFDDVIGGMWVSPSTCHPVGSTIAHEIGHSFQYQCFCDLHGAVGFRYNWGPSGCSYWEATAQWQSVMAYPDEMYAQSMYVYRKTHNMAMSHEWMRYQSYWMHYWWADRYGDDMIGRLWRGATTWGDDVNQVYMKLNGKTAVDLYRDYMDAAMHFVTWDFQNEDWRRRGSYFDIGNFVYNYVPVGAGEFQVAYYSCPQSTGYNVIPLDVPQAGTTISTLFTALPPGSPLADGDPRMFWNGNNDAPIATDTYNHFANESARGFRLGYVALKRNGERVYSTEDKVYCTGTDETSVDVSFTVPADVERLWFVVSPAPSSYIMHEWDENILNDDQWPYRVKFEGTGIPGSQRYYLYDMASDNFLSRGGEGGVSAVADAFGLPVYFSNQDGGVQIQMMDNTRAWLGGTTALTTIANVATTYYPENTADGSVAYRTAGGSYLRIDNRTGNVVATATRSTATHWQLLTSSQRAAVITRRSQQQDMATARKANIGLGGQTLARYAETNFAATDMTSRVNNAALAENTNGWTLTGRDATAEARALEVYEGTGTELSQTVSGLPKGLYRVSIHAFYRDGWPATCVGFANDGFPLLSNAWLQANGVRVQIADWAGQHSGDQYPNFRNEARACFDEGRYRNEVYTFVDDDGQLNIRFGSPQYMEGGWFCFANMMLTYYGMNDVYEPSYSDIVSHTPDYPERSLYDGKYFFLNRASNTFLTAAGAFGTQASLGTGGLDITLAYKQNGHYTLNTQIANGTDLHFLGKPENVGGATFMDAAAFNYALEKNDDGFYTLSFDATSNEGDRKTFYLGYNSNRPSVVSTRLSDPTDIAAQWKVMKRTELVAWINEQAKEATPDAPVDITVLLAAPNFSRNDQRNTSAWRGTPTIDGNMENFCAEKFNTSFDVYQTLTGLPAGDYRVKAQGFYRHGLPQPAYQAFTSQIETGAAELYANEAAVPLVSIFSEAQASGFPSNEAGRWTTPATGYTVPDDMQSASTAFSKGFYENSLDVHVGDNGRLRIGFRKKAGNTPEGNWSIFDNVRLYILRPDIINGIVTPQLADAYNHQAAPAVYDLQGRRVATNLHSSRLTPGVYIVNSRKVIVK